MDLDNFVNLAVGTQIIVIGSIIVYEYIIFYRQSSRKNGWHWIKLFYALVGGYWVVIYLYRMINPDVAGTMLWHQGMIRPGIILTLTSIATSGIVRMKLKKE